MNATHSISADRDHDDAIKAMVRTPDGLHQIILALGGMIVPRNLARCPNSGGLANGDTQPSVLIGGADRDEGLRNCRWYRIRGDRIIPIRVLESISFRDALNRASDFISSPPAIPTFLPSAASGRGESEAADDRCLPATPKAMAPGDQSLSYGSAASCRSSK